MGLAHASAARRYRGITVFFSSLAGIEGIPADLLDRTAHPKVPETPIAVVEEGATRRLIHSLNARAFEDRRDQAVVAPLVHTGVRLAALAGLRVEDRNTDGRRSTMPGKGRKYRPGRRPVVLAGRLQLPATPTAQPDSCPARPGQLDRRILAAAHARTPAAWHAARVLS
ncbi:MAG: hypothetical protein AMXMBFR80_26760 [Dehalococcoidia bacterium]